MYMKEKNILQVFCVDCPFDGAIKNIENEY